MFKIFSPCFVNSSDVIIQTIPAWTFLCPAASMLASSEGKLGPAVSSHVSPVLYLKSVELLGWTGSWLGKRHLVSAVCPPFLPSPPSRSVFTFSPRIAANSHVCQILTEDSKVEDCPMIFINIWQRKREKERLDGWMYIWFICWVVIILVWWRGV